MSEEVRFLIEFKEDLKIYYQSKKNYYKSAIYEEENNDELREKINRSSSMAASYILLSGLPTTIKYAPPPAIGGFAGDIDLIANIFNLDKLQISESWLYDLIDRSIGIYAYWDKQKWKKWLNPFYWIGQIIRLPFLLINFSGFDSSKIEISIIGKMYKLIFSFGTGLLLVLELYSHYKNLKK